MAQLFEKVDLRGEGELLKIQQLLDEALDSRLQVAGDELTEQDRQELRATSAAFVEQLRQFVVFAENDGGANSAVDTQRTLLMPVAASLALRSPLLKPLSPPPADAEVQQLEGEVTAASLRVAKLRTGMQSRLQDMLAAKLAACRPTAELEPEGEGVPGADQQLAVTDVPAAADDLLEQQDGAAPAKQQQAVAADGQEPGGGQAEAKGEQQVQPLDGDDAEVPAAAAATEPATCIPLLPQPQELQQRLLQAANRMPALRAQLEQAADKLQRVVAAVTADINRPPPNTVEKAVLGKTPGKPAMAAAAATENEAGVSPLFKQALESGQVSTRRRVARDVQPVPYNSQLE